MKCIVRTSTLLFASMIAAVAHPKIARDLDLVNPSSNIDVIVQFAAPVSESQHTKVRQRGGSLKRELPSIRASLYSVPAQSLQSLANDPDVVYVSPDRQVRGLLDYTNPTVNGGIAFQSGWTGEGVAIAVIDSGMDTKHSDLQDGNKSRVVDQLGLGADGSTYSIDKNGHGTHVAASPRATRARLPAPGTPGPFVESRRKPTSSICGCWIRTAPGPTAW